MYPDCPYHAEWNPGMPAGIPVGGGMPGPSVLVHARGVGDGDGEGDAEGDADGDAVGDGVGVDPTCVTPASPPAPPRPSPSDAPADATPYTPGSTSTKANPPLPSATVERTGTPS